MLEQVGNVSFRLRWKRGLFLGLTLVSLGVVWVGSNRVPANATREIRWRGEAEHKSLSGPTFRVAAFNIHGGKGRDSQLDLPRIADCLAEVRPHFAGLNEVRGNRFGTRLNQAEELGKHLGMAALFVPTERRFWQPSFGNGLLSRVSTTPVHRLPLPCTQGKRYRTASLASFQVGGQSVRVLSVHLDRVKDREVQLERVFSLFCDLETPAILMGDLNTTSNDPLLAKWLKDSDIRDAVSDSLGDADSPRRIDWILTRGLTTVSAGCLANEASDHPLVWAELKIPGQPQSARRIETTKRQ